MIYCDFWILSTFAASKGQILNFYPTLQSRCFPFIASKVGIALKIKISSGGCSSSDATAAHYGPKWPFLFEYSFLKELCESERASLARYNKCHAQEIVTKLKNC